MTPWSTNNKTLWPYFSKAGPWFFLFILEYLFSDLFTLSLFPGNCFFAAIQRPAVASSRVETSVAIEISFRKIPWNRLGTVFFIPQKKVLIPCFSKGSISQFGIKRNETEFRKIIKYYEVANKRGLFSSVFCPQKWFGTDFWVFSVLRIGWNGIPRFFLFENGFERNSEVCFLFWKWFGTEFQGFFGLPKMVQNGIPRFFSSENGAERNSKGFSLPRRWFGTEFRGFSLPRNGRNSDGTAVCSVLFRIPRNNFCRKMAALEETHPGTNSSPLTGERPDSSPGPEFLNILKWWLGWRCECKASKRVFRYFNIKFKCRIIQSIFSLNCLHKMVFTIITKIEATVSPAVHSEPLKRWLSPKSRLLSLY